MGETSFRTEIPAYRNREREGFVFSSFVSVLMHLVIILGVSFFSPQTVRSITVDLVPVHDPSKETPHASEYESYADQRGSGVQTENRPARVPLMPLVVRHELLPQSRLVSGRPDSARDPGNSPGVRADELRSVAGPPTYDTGARGAEAQSQSVNTARDSLEAEIIGLESYLGTLEEQYARRPRIKRYTSIAARGSPAAAYIHNWVKRVERVGNLNYPRQAVQQKLNGDLRLLVVLNALGETAAVRILETSGHPELDDAALRIVRLAEPFGEFPTELRDEADVIEIIRTWRFVSEYEGGRLEFE